MNEYIKNSKFEYVWVCGYALDGDVGSWCRCAPFGVYHVPSLVRLKAGTVSNH